MNKALAFLLIIFIADMITPFGIALGLLYCVCIFMVITQRRRDILLITTLASVFTIAKFAVHYSPEIPYFFIANRAITVATLWIAAIIAIKFRLLHERQKLVTEIERKNKESEQFIYIASHDLNEPVRTIKSMALLMEQNSIHALDDNGRQFLFYIQRSAERMGNLIQSLLEYGKIGRNSVTTQVNCNQVVNAVKQDLSLLLAETGATVTLKKLPIISAYAGDMRFLFQNLIENAVKFRSRDTPPVVHVSARQSGDAWLFSVCDNGIGIDPKNHDKIFTMFKRLHADDEYEGTGIGLAHCLKIVEMHHGKIWVKSKPGKGSSFYFIIPTN